MSFSMTPHAERPLVFHSLALGLGRSVPASHALRFDVVYLLPWPAAILARPFVTVQDRQPEPGVYDVSCFPLPPHAGQVKI